MSVDTMEARTWIKSSRHPTPLAPGRFPDAGDALDFVYKLYRAGAVEVFIDDDGGSDSARSLLVELPDEPERRAALFDICNHERIRAGQDDIEDDGQQSVALRWS